MDKMLTENPTFYFRGSEIDCTDNEMACASAGQMAFRCFTRHALAREGFQKKGHVPQAMRPPAWIAGIVGVQEGR